MLFFLPYVVPFVATVFIWGGMLNPETGWINAALEALGVENPPPWLEDPGWVYPGLALIGVWGIGAGMIVYLAGLQGHPDRALRRGTHRRRRRVGVGCATSRSRC